MTMASTDKSHMTGRSRRGVLIRQPLIVLAIALGCIALALTSTLVMPIGPMYWDHYIYLDAANRIFDGQIPSVDFFAPVGGLGYYLFAAWLHLFPNGHPLLLASWSLMTVSAPLMALIVWNVQKRSVPLAYGLLLPFLFFSLLPFNTGDFYPYPGSDGFGIYNRQICQLLYVLAAGLVFVRGWMILAATIALIMLALLFTKITGVVAGLVLCLIAFFAGRLPLRAAITSGIFFFAALAAVETGTGMVSAYEADILSLLLINDTSLLPRLLQAASLNFGILLACGILGVVLFVGEWPVLAERFRDCVARPGFSVASRLFDQHWIWIVGFVAAGLIFESQNTGSQAFIFLWPLLLSILVEHHQSKLPPARFAVIAVLVIGAVLPPAVAVAQKAARAWIGAVNNRTLETSNLKTMGAVGVRDIMGVRAQRMRQSYITDRATYQGLANLGELPSFLLYSDLDFQALLLETGDEAISAIRNLEREKNIRFETIMTIDFTNPFAWLMDRHAPKYIAIGADPYRAVPSPDARVRAAVGAVDIALYPTCPPTTARLKLLNLYQPSLDQTHSRMTLTPCFDAFVRNELINGR